jgi:hypothetical protein
VHWSPIARRSGWPAASGQIASTRFATGLAGARWSAQAWRCSATWRATCAAAGRNIFVLRSRRAGRRAAGSSASFRWTGLTATRTAARSSTQSCPLSPGPAGASSTSATGSLPRRSLRVRCRSPPFGIADLLAPSRTQGTAPKVVSVNTASEYWRADGSLSHIDTQGSDSTADSPGPASTTSLVPSIWAAGRSALPFPARRGTTCR